MAVLLTSCLKDKDKTVVHNYTEDDYKVIQAHLNLPVEVDEYTLELPQTVGGFRVFADNKQATLGRVLFYDKRLSVNKEVNSPAWNISVTMSQPPTNSPAT